MSKETIPQSIIDKIKEAAKDFGKKEPINPDAINIKFTHPDYHIGILMAFNEGGKFGYGLSEWRIKELEAENKELHKIVNDYETVQCGGSLEILVKRFLKSQQPLSPEMTNVLNETYSRLFSKTPTRLDI